MHHACIKPLCLAANARAVQYSSALLCMSSPGMQAPQCDASLCCQMQSSTCLPCVRHMLYPPTLHMPATRHALIHAPTICLPYTHVPPQVDDLDIFAIGPNFERNQVFPAKTNTEFTEVLSRSHVRMVVWERGAGRTLACGTGACATVVAGVLEGKVDRNCRVDLPGGPLQIEWRESDNHIYMTGPAELVFDGVVKV